MKKIVFILAVAGLLVFTSCKGTPKLETKQDTLSWALGESLAKGLIENNINDIDNDIVLAAVQATVKGKKQPIDDQTYADAVAYLQNQMMMERQTAQLAGNKAAAEAEAKAFRELEQSHPNAVKHPSGFYYEVIKQGSGAKCKFADLVNFDYKGYNMLTGKEFDNTKGEGGHAIQHVVGNPMFPGLIEGLQLMNPGSTYRFYFPSKLAFGANGSGDLIPPYTPVIYEVELHKIVK